MIIKAKKIHYSDSNNLSDSDSQTEIIIKEKI